MAMSRRQQKAMFASMNSPRAAPMRPQLLREAKERAAKVPGGKGEVKDRPIGKRIGYGPYDKYDFSKSTNPLDKSKIKAERYSRIKNSSHVKDEKTGDIYFQ